MTSQIADFRDLSPAITVRQTEADLSQASPTTPNEDQPTVAALSDPSPEAPQKTPQVAEAELGAADEISAPMLDTAPPSAPDGLGESGTDSISVAAEDDATPTLGDAPTDAPLAGSPASVIAGSPTTDTPPEPGAPALAPAASAPDTQQAVVTAPAPPVPGNAPESEQFALADIPRVSTTLPTVGAANPPPSPTTLPETSEAPDPIDTADVVAAGAEPEAADGLPGGLLPTEDQTPSASQFEVPAAPAASTLAPDANAIEVAEAPSAGDAEGTAPLQTPEANDQVEVGSPAGSGGEIPVRRLPGQRVAGLPQIGQSGALGSTREDDAAASEAEPSAPEAELSALDRNKSAFTAPEGAGLIAVVLLQGEGPALPMSNDAETSVPVTVAVPARHPDAREVASGYREAGLEVALIPDLPEGATGRDVAVALPINLASIPGAVALMDADGDDFQNDRTAIEGVVAAAAESGHGLLTWPKGFNTASRLASEEGVPSAMVFRTLEAGNPQAVVRALDQAAFRARQDGGVVLVGPAEADVIDGLQLWAEGTRRSDTSLAPLSAVLGGG